LFSIQERVDQEMIKNKFLDNTSTLSILVARNNFNFQLIVVMGLISFLIFIGVGCGSNVEKEDGGGRQEWKGWKTDYNKN